MPARRPWAIEDLAERRDVGAEQAVGWNGGVFDERQWTTRPGARGHQSPRLALRTFRSAAWFAPAAAPDQCVITVPVTSPQVADR